VFFRAARTSGAGQIAGAIMDKQIGGSADNAILTQSTKHATCPPRQGFLM
jgi:hypothetical protein